MNTNLPTTSDPDLRAAETLGPARWTGHPGRLEVWYATFTDPATGTGFWLHGELLARVDGPAHLHGWAAVFPPGAPPILERFGPHELAGSTPGSPHAWFDTGEVRFGPATMTGRAGSVSWDLAYRDTSAPLYTFPAYVWHRQLLASSQVVPWPTANITGTVTVGGRTLELEAARGALSRIHGHGNAQRWGWLHADLGGGDVLEVVAAVGRQSPLNRLPPMAFARLRVDGDDWPSDPLRAAPFTRVRLDLPRWYATIRSPAQRVRVGVRIPPGGAVTLEYRDPDDAPAWCTNSCRADAEVRLERRRGMSWEPVRSWSLQGTAHAELGERPA